ncbi:MAG: oxidoreductase [Rhodobacteraceae bacterium]|nr:MAG: oxidoreductase [Paracoccaceae bacterium]
MTSTVDKTGVAVVTGAGSGLGQALAINLTSKGFKVIGFGRNISSLKDTSQQCDGKRFETMVVDVSKVKEVIKAFDIINKKYNSIDILFNNAAVYPRRDILDETGQSFMQTVDINLGGTVNVTCAALELMVRVGHGRIINVTSFADMHPLPASAAYSVSKGAQRIFTRTLIADLADRFPNIVVSDWLPGMLNTQMGVSDGLDPQVAAKWGVALALEADPSYNGTIFEMGRELLPPRSVKGRIKDAVLMRRRQQRYLDA